MINRFAYCIDSPHYYHHFNFLRNFHWLCSNNQHASIITTGNLAVESLVAQIGAPLNHILKPIPLAPLDPVEALRPDEVYWNLEPHFPNFPEEQLSIMTTITPDRCVGYIHNSGTKTIAEAIIQENNLDSLLIFGSGTDTPINSYPIIRQALEKQIPIIGFPFGNVTGRYAPYWLKYCDKIFISSDSAYDSLVLKGNQKDTLFRYEPMTLNIQNTSSEKVGIVIDVGIHSSRHELVKLVKSLLTNHDPRDIFIQTNQAPSFIDFIGTYLKIHNIPEIAVGNNLATVFKAKHLFCLFPFACKYLLENFSLNIPTTIVDLQNRYTKIDGLVFPNCKILSNVKQLSNEETC